MENPYVCTRKRVDAFELQIGDKFLDTDDVDHCVYEMISFDEREWVIAKVIWPPEHRGRTAGFGYNTEIGEAYAPDLYRVKEASCMDYRKNTEIERPRKPS
jgi:hypothetical protein